MKARIRETLLRLTEKFPELKQKPEIKVLVYLGLGHSTVFHDLRKEYASISVTRSKNKRPFNVYPVLEQFSQMKYWGKDMDDVLYARTIFFNLLFHMMHLENISTDKITEITRKITDSFTLADLKALSKKLGNEPDEDRKYKIIDRAIEEKGLIAPNTEEKIKKLLAY